ncbi:MAG: tetratricopeptide repeat protein [Thiotrichaceae bacterium]|nr:tetratricopeptide repeat protein [Thiotrichaceae bacterium]
MNLNKRVRLADEKFEAGEKARDLLKYQEAADNFLEAAELLKGIKGKEADYAACLSNAANRLHALGFYDKARYLLEQTMLIQKKFFGYAHPHVANSLNNLAAVYHSQGNYKQAEQLYEKALAMREKILGFEHPDIASSLNNLAKIYQIQGNTEKAKEYYQRAQAIINKVFDENHPTAKMIAENYLELQQEVEELRKRDIEQRVALEEAKKLEYLSYMATGIAHNINNPVGIIQLAAQRGLRELEKGMSVEKGQEIFQRILRQANRLDDIIQNFRDYTNGNRKNIENVELNKVVEHIKGYFENQLEAHKIKLHIELAENPYTQANNFVLQEVLINLISNAREALENIPDASILIKTWQTAEKVGFIVEDNGVGIPEEQQKSLFSPFHSTKAHGTGLGLHFTQKALMELHGTIRYENRIPNGACFIIELPRTGESV